jgi:hypothetical protein
LTKKAQKNRTGLLEITNFQGFANLFRLSGSHQAVDEESNSKKKPDRSHRPIVAQCAKHRRKQEQDGRRVIHSRKVGQIVLFFPGLLPRSSASTIPNSEVDRNSMLQS